MKIIRLIMLLGLIVVLSGCSGSGAEKAARNWLEAGATADGATALKLTCTPLQADVQMMGFMTAGVGMLTGLNPQDAEVDTSDITYETVSEDGDTAYVHVQGEIITSLMGAAMPQPINSTFKMIKEDGEWKWCGE